MKKFIYSLILIGSFALYATFQNRLSSTAALFSDSRTVTPPANLDLSNVNLPSNVADANLNTNSNPPTNTSTNTPPSNTNTTPPQTTPPATKPKGQYKDGSYVGNAADAYYGNIQVKVIISGGKITDVVFLQYPNDRNTSREINSQAMPYLRAEAIQAQSANVQIVSGASDSSMAFRESLASALSQAKA